jgi:hypothetical protein
MKEIIKECQVCGAKYKGCNFCEQQNQFLAWRSVVCKPEHFAYHIPIIAYVRNQMTKEEAKKELLAAEKEYGEIEYADNIRNIVAKIKGTNKLQKSKISKTKGLRAKTNPIDESIADSDKEREEILSSKIDN